mgnify:CR=1 FL=1
MAKAIVRTMDEAYAVIDGATMTIDGVQGTLRVVTRRGMSIVEHCATAKGKASAAYQDARRKLGDDYVSDVTDTDAFLNFLGRRVDLVK